MSSARRARDKWRAKKWYTISTPSYFGDSEIGTTPAEEPDQLDGRIIDTTLYDITGDFSQQHIKLYFQVMGRKGQRLETIFKGHEYSRDYLRSLVRRGSSRIDLIHNATTKTGHKVRVSVVLFSVMRIQTSQIQQVRRIVEKVLDEKAAALNFDQFVQEAVLGKMASDVYNEAKKVFPIRHAGVRKTKLMAIPEQAPVEVEVKA